MDAKERDVATMNDEEAFNNAIKLSQRLCKIVADEMDAKHVGVKEVLQAYGLAINVTFEVLPEEFLDEWLAQVKRTDQKAKRANQGVH